MTLFHPSGYDRSRETGGRAISEQPRERYDFDRLERSIDVLVERHQVLQAHHSELKSALTEREQRIGALGEEILQFNQRRQGAAKRLDDLIAQVAALEHKFSASSGR